MKSAMASRAYPSERASAPASKSNSKRGKPHTVMSCPFSHLAV